MDNPLEEVTSPVSDDCTSSREVNYDLGDLDSDNRIVAVPRPRLPVEGEREEVLENRERVALRPLPMRYGSSLEVSLEKISLEEVSLENVETITVVPRPQNDEQKNQQSTTPKPSAKRYRSSEEASVEELEAVLEKDNKGKYSFGAQSGMGIGVSQSGWICRRL